MLKFLAVIPAVFVLLGAFFLLKSHGSQNLPLPAALTRQSSQTQFPQSAVSASSLEQIASNKYANGNLPLGDGKYITSGPKKGYIYLCNIPPKDDGGAQKAGSWIHGDSWNINEKAAVWGKVSWPNAQFSDTVSSDTRVLYGNDLPVSTITGIFPIQSSDPAYQYDRNPNSIEAQSFRDTLPLNPVYSSTPYCMGMEVGVMVNGVALFNGFDASLRDAAAHEVQDSCQGHPQSGGEYHYHSLSSCINNATVSDVIGFALDGFPITGPMVSDGKYLTTDDLDECHGITSAINLDGKSITMYHYVMTEDFPYSVSCFRGKPASLQVIQSAGAKMYSSPSQQGGNSQRGGQGSPPQAAVSACDNKVQGANCSFITPNGTVSGMCEMPPGESSLACVPAQPQGANRGALQ